MVRKEIMITCPKCHGKGFYKVPMLNDEYFGVDTEYEKVPCEMCHIKGKITLQFYEEIQRKCRGEEK